MKNIDNAELMYALQAIRYRLDYWEKPLDPDAGWYSGDAAEQALLDEGLGYTIGQVREIIFQLFKKGYLKFSDYRIGGGRFRQLIRITKKGQDAAMLWVLESEINTGDWYM